MHSFGLSALCFFGFLLVCDAQPKQLNSFCSKSSDCDTHLVCDPDSVCRLREGSDCSEGKEKLCSTSTTCTKDNICSKSNEWFTPGKIVAYVIGKLFFLFETQKILWFYSLNEVTKRKISVDSDNKVVSYLILSKHPGRQHTGKFYGMYWKPLWDQVTDLMKGGIK